MAKEPEKRRKAERLADLPPDLWRIVRSVLADYPELTEQKAIEMCKAAW